MENGMPDPPSFGLTLRVIVLAVIAWSEKEHDHFCYSLTVENHIAAIDKRTICLLFQLFLLPTIFFLQKVKVRTWN